MLTIVGRQLGGRRPLFEQFSVPPPPALNEGGGDGGGPMKLRDLIAHVVTHEVEQFEKRREARRLDRVLSPQQIERGESAGKIDPAGRPSEAGPSKPVDLAAAVQAALDAFVDGLYLVVIDEQEYRELDAFVALRPDSRLTFIRLTFLAGA